MTGVDEIRVAVGDALVLRDAFFASRSGVYRAHVLDAEHHLRAVLGEAPSVRQALGRVAARARAREEATRG